MSAPTDRFGGLPLPAGAGFGTVAYLLGYLSAYLLAGDRVRRSALARLLELFSGDPATWKVVGWLFYNAHLVDVVVPGLVGTRSVNLLADAEGSVRALYVLVPLFLAAAGAVVAHRNGSATPTAGATAGATVVAAYLPLTVVGTFAFTVTVTENPIRPVFATSFLLAGLVYPVVFGGLGGAVRGLTRDEPTD